MTRRRERGFSSACYAGGVNGNRIAAVAAVIAAVFSVVAAIVGVTSNVATTDDLTSIRLEMRESREQSEAQMRELRQEMLQEMRESRERSEAQMRELRQEMRESRERSEAQMRELRGYFVDHLDSHAPPVDDD